MKDLELGFETLPENMGDSLGHPILSWIGLNWITPVARVIQILHEKSEQLCSDRIKEGKDPQSTSDFNRFLPEDFRPFNAIMRH